jgi:hypothetical protein
MSLRDELAKLGVPLRKTNVVRGAAPLTLSERNLVRDEVPLRRPNGTPYGTRFE